MGERDQVAFDVSPDDWVAEVRKLSAKVGEAGLCVRLLFQPDILVSAIGFRPQVHGQQIHIVLGQQSPSGSSNGDILVSLPVFGQGGYRKAEGTSEEMFLSVGWWPCGDKHPAMAELQIATSQEFLDFVTNVTRIQ